MMKNRLMPLTGLLSFLGYLALTAFSPGAQAAVSNSTTRVNSDEGASASTIQQPGTTSTTMVAPANGAETTTTTTTQQAGTAAAAAPARGEQFEQTVITEKQATQGGLRNEAVGIIPQFGILSLEDSLGETQSRGVAGLIVDINALRRVDDASGRPFFGPSLGVLYSHLGTPRSDFFGMDDPLGRDNGTHLLMFPFNLKGGYTFRDIFRSSIHAGATLLYNNQPALATGIETNNSSTTVRANIGMDFEFGVGKSVAIMLRPDWVFAPNTTIFVGTFGVTFPIS